MIIRFSSIFLQMNILYPDLVWSSEKHVDSNIFTQ